MAAVGAWVLNFDAEDELAAAPRAYTPSRAVRSRFEALAARVLALLGPRDRVLVPVLPQVGPLPSPPRAFLGRAWCPTPRAIQAFCDAGVEVPRAPPLDVLCRVNHRRFCAELGQTLPGARFVDTMDAVLETIAAPSPTGHWLLKRPFSFTGRGRRKIHRGSVDAADRSFIEASLAPRGSSASAMGLQVEPWVELRGDVALHGFLSASGRITLGEPTVQALDATGAWRGSARAGPDDLSIDERRALIEAAHEAAVALRGAGYFGPFGVDAFRWINADGSMRFNPRCEINARYSMGWAIGMGDVRPDLAEP